MTRVTVSLLTTSATCTKFLDSSSTRQRVENTARWIKAKNVAVKMQIFQSRLLKQIERRAKTLELTRMHLVCKVEMEFKVTLEHCRVEEERVCQMSV